MGPEYADAEAKTKANGILFEKALITAKHWHNVLDGLILQADQQGQMAPEIPMEKEEEVSKASV